MLELAINKEGEQVQKEVRGNTSERMEVRGCPDPSTNPKGQREKGE